MSKSIKMLFVYCVLLFSLFAGGCSWQKIPTHPEYTHTSSLPITVGVVLKNTPASNLYGPRIIEEWKRVNLFNEIVYPYRKGDHVDTVLELDVTGQWVGKGAGAGFVIGLTLGLASPFIGPSMDGNHSLAMDVTLSNDLKKIYTTNVSTKITWGLGANANDVGAKADSLQIRKLAVAGSHKLMEDKDTIIKSIGK